MVSPGSSSVDRPPRRRRVAVLLVAAALATGLAGIGDQPVAAAPSTPVMARSQLSAAQVASWFRSTGKVSRATVSIEDLAEAFISEGAAEGVAGDLAFAQSIIETGWFTFSARVTPAHNNFSGLGAVDGGGGAAAFPDARTGVRAQIQHLRAYADPTATTANLAHPLVDPRFRYVTPKGRAPNWEDFGGGTWASDATYATKVLSVYQQMRSWVGVTNRWAPFSSVDALVARGHRDLLFREGTAEERQAAATALDRGTTTVTGLLAALVEGEGSRHAEPITRLYLVGLGRLPDPGGLTYWTARHREGVVLLRLAQQFLASPEFQRRYGAPANGEYVALLYRNVLGREADANGADYWGRRLAGGQITRAGLLVQFSESPEHVRLSEPRVEASVVYLGMLGREPDPSVLSWWATKHADGSPLAELIDLVYASAEYAARVG